MRPSTFIFASSLLFQALIWAYPLHDGDAAVAKSDLYLTLDKRQGQCLRPEQRSQIPPSATQRTINFLNPEAFSVEGVQVVPTRIRRGRYRMHFTTNLQSVQRRAIFFFPPEGATTTTGGELDVVTLSRTRTETEITYDYNNPDGSEDSDFEVYTLNTS